MLGYLTDIFDEVKGFASAGKTDDGSFLYHI